MLNWIERDDLFQQDGNEYVSFSIHHKQNPDNHIASLQNWNDFDQRGVGKIMPGSYNEALELTKRLKISR
jgi:hypothetical protein